MRLGVILMVLLATLNCNGQNKDQVISLNITSINSIDEFLIIEGEDSSDDKKQYLVIADNHILNDRKLETGDNVRLILKYYFDTASSSVDEKKLQIRIHGKTIWNGADSDKKPYRLVELLK